MPKRNRSRSLPARTNLYCDDSTSVSAGYRWLRSLLLDLELRHLDQPRESLLVSPSREVMAGLALSESRSGIAGKSIPIIRAKRPMVRPQRGLVQKVDRMARQVVVAGLLLPQRAGVLLDCRTTNSSSDLRSIVPHPITRCLLHPDRLDADSFLDSLLPVEDPIAASGHQVHRGGVGYHRTSWWRVKKTSHYDQRRKSTPLKGSVSQYLLHPRPLAMESFRELLLDGQAVSG